MAYRKSQVLLSAEAETDLMAILDFSERRWGERQRQIYSATLEHAFSVLMAESGIGRNRDELRPGLRSQPVGSHIIYYLPLDTELRVIRILHRRQDPTKEEW